MKYEVYEDLPEWSKHLVYQMIILGVIQYDNRFEFPLSDELLQVLLILSRKGII